MQKMAKLEIFQVGIDFLFYMHKWFACICLWTTCIAYLVPKETEEGNELELQMIVSHHTSARNQT